MRRLLALLSLGLTVSCATIDEGGELPKFEKGRTESSRLQSSSCPNFQLPSSFRLVKSESGSNADLTIQAGNRELGRIQHRTQTWGQAFELRVGISERIAIAESRLFPWGMVIDIFDCERKKIGEIKENFYRSIFERLSILSVLDENLRLIAQSKHGTWLTSRVRVADSEGRPVLTMSRSSTSSDHWNIESHQQGRIDARVAAFFGAAKMYAEEGRAPKAKRRK